MPKPCRDNQIRNPATRRCVKKTGRIGKKLVPPVTQNRIQFVDQLQFMPPEMIFEITKSFNAKDAENFLKAYPYYAPFFQDKFLNNIKKFKPKFMKDLRTQISSVETKLVKMAMVMRVIYKYPNDKHVIYLGKTGAKKFSQIMAFMDTQGYNFLKYAYREQRQTTKNVSRGIQNQLRRNGGDNLVYDYMTVGKIFYPGMTEPKPSGISTAKAIQHFFNKTDNHNGKHIKILFISEKFKEGIDLLDVPHIHIIDEPITDDEKKQIVGRIVRRCSRAGTPFNNGWKSNVFEYKIKMPKHNIDKIQHWLGEEEEESDADRFSEILKRNAVDVFVNKNIHKFKITPGHSSLETDEILSLRKPNINLSPKVYNTQVETIFKRFEAKIDKMENKCVDRGQRFEFTPQQNFIRHYFNEQSDIDTMLLWHAAGAGKTATAIATISSSFEQAGRNIIYVTRNSLIKDINKNLYGNQTAHLEFRRRPMTQGARSRYLNRNWIQPMSYTTFMNIISTRHVRQRDGTMGEINNMAKRKLKRKTRNRSILENSLIIIDEVHKLTSDDMVDILSEVISKPYIKKPKILLMSATPFETPSHKSFILSLFERSRILNSDIAGITKGKVSYFDPRTDIRYYPQAITKYKTISLPVPNYNELKRICNSRQKKERDNIDKSQLSNIEKTAAKLRIKNRTADCKNPSSLLPNITKVFKKYDK